ncbi:hypothetical protein BUALT_Bualt10G0069400 [Buddleja alternifolia]|uniref:Uncharacterized protein n=1 Tax=Buddleja alternifolia TaxID=168488 RepID=A0AAV6X1C7_9LAMI|nr:hypothetical protein BUALT_Bualt10G0069400 [Buddleja alternifolia]
MKNKIILHPIMVNLIMELPHNCNIETTHIDSSGVFIWDVEAQVNHQSVVGVKASKHDLTLTGHKDNAEFAQSSAKAFVFKSGTEDNILNISDVEKIGEWNTEDLKTIVSMSDDATKLGGEGTLQTWRMIDLFYRLKKKVLAKLEKLKVHTPECSSS